MRLFTRNGHDWVGPYPAIAVAAAALQARSFLIDGEAVASFALLRRRAREKRATRHCAVGIFGIVSGPSLVRSHTGF